MRKTLFTSITAAFSGLMYKLGKDGSLEQKNPGQDNTQPNILMQYIKKIPEFVVGSSENVKKLGKKRESLGIQTTFKDNAITSIINTIKINDYCQIMYSNMQRSPLAVIERINESCLSGNNSTVYHFFDEDSVEPRFRAPRKIYEDSADSYFPLHLASPANYKKDIGLIKTTYTYANSVLQKKNTEYVKHWRNMEQYCRNLIIENKCENLTIISGPIYNSGLKYLDKKTVLVIDNVYINQHELVADVPIPQKLFKIIECRKDNNKYNSAYIFEKYRFYQQAINQIENQTGLIFPIDRKSQKLIEYAPTKF